MSKGLVLQRQYQGLCQQNEALRIKAKKINQIQTYVNILMQSSQACQQQLNRSNLQNKQLKNHIDKLMGQNMRLEKVYQNEFRQMESEYKRQLMKRDEQIRMLEIGRQKDRQMFEQTLGENQSRSRGDMERIKLEFLHMERQYEEEIKKLTQILKDKCRQCQLAEQSKKQLKRAYSDESNNIKLELNKLERAYHDVTDDNFHLKEQLTKLSRIINEARQAQSSLKKQIGRREDEWGSDRRSYEKRIKSVQESLSEVSNRQKKLQLKYNEVVDQLEKYKRQYGLSQQKIDDLSHSNKKLERLLQQCEQSSHQLMIKLQQTQEQSSRSSKRYTEQLKRLEQQLQLSNERFLSQKRNCDSMRGEIQDLLKVIDKLESNLRQSQNAIEMLNKENQVLFKEVQNLTKDIRIKQEEVNDFQQKYKQAKQNYLMIEELHQKETSKSAMIQHENEHLLQELQSITRQQKSIHQQEVSHLIEKHLEQKRDMLESHRIQKQNLAKKFQVALKQKDDQAKRRLELLQNQIGLMRVRH